MRRRRLNVAVVLFLAMSTGAALANGCAATPGNNTFTTSTAGGAGGVGGFSFSSSFSGSGTGGDIIIIPWMPVTRATRSKSRSTDPRASQCGPVQLCDQAPPGSTTTAMASSTRAAPARPDRPTSASRAIPVSAAKPAASMAARPAPSRAPGPCVGGVHAFPPTNRFLNDTDACHAISSPPYADVSLKVGTGNFSANAVPGSETYEVTCPPGVSQCPTVSPPDVYKPLQSGESITYTKMVAGDPNPKTCTYPLFVGAPGLRVELSWEHTTADTGVDLDLHLHQPDNTQPWGISPRRAAGLHLVQLRGRGLLPAAGLRLPALVRRPARPAAHPGELVQRPRPPGEQHLLQRPSRRRAGLEAVLLRLPQPAPRRRQHHL